MVGFTLEDLLMISPSGITLMNAYSTILSEVILMPVVSRSKKARGFLRFSAIVERSESLINTSSGF
jgi:hypothetical protein